MKYQRINEDYHDLTTGNIGSKLIRFALPIIAANLLQALYSLVDMAIVGHYNMAAGMSAVNMGGLIIQIIFVVAMSMNNGGSVVIGQLLGSKRIEDAKKAAGTVLSLLICAAVILTLVTIIIRVPLLHLMNTTEEAFDGAVSYLTICVSGTVVVFIYNANSGILRAAGESVKPLIAVATCAVLNLLLDILMVGVLGMGPAGAATATVVSQLISAVITTVFVKKIGLLEFNFRFLRINKEYAKSIIKISLPNCIQYLLVQLSFAFANSLINQFSTQASAAAGAVSKIGNFAQLPTQSTSAAIMALTAQNLGANKLDNVKKGVRYGAVVGIGITLIIAGVIWIMPDKLLGIMTPDLEVVRVGVPFFRWVALSYIFEGVLFTMHGVLIGAGYTNITMICGVSSSLVLRLSFAWLFVQFTSWGFAGIGVAYAMAPFGAMIIALAFYLSGKWTKPRVKV